MTTHHEDNAIIGMNASANTLRGKPSLGMIGMLVVNLIVGYEWFMSGLVKVVRGDFPSGLADELLEKSEGVPNWYRNFMLSAFIPNAEFFGYVIEIAELLAGIALILGALIWLFAWDRVSDRVRVAVHFFIAVAAIGATFLVINLHLANGAPHPWFIPKSGFDEGIDLDSILPAIQIVTATICIICLKRFRQNKTETVTASAPQAKASASI